MWEARLWLALDHETPVDIVSTMGPDIEVEQLLELYFVAHPLVDWRETIRETGSGRQRRMMLRVRVDSSASAECWVTMPQCRLPLEGDAQEIEQTVRLWLLRLSDTSKNGVAEVLAGLAAAPELPPTVAVRRRQLKSGVGADGLLLEQSDVSSVANLGVNRLFRCVRVEGSSAVTVHRAMLALRQRYPAAGFVQSLPDFARTLLRTRRPAAVAPPPAAAAIATDDGAPATPARTGDSVAGDDALSAGLSAAPSAPLGGGRAADDALSASLLLEHSWVRAPRNSAAQFGRAIRRNCADGPARPRAGALDQGRLLAPAVARPRRRRPRARRAPGCHAQARRQPGGGDAKLPGASGAADARRGGGGGACRSAREACRLPWGRDQ